MTGATNREAAVDREGYRLHRCERRIAERKCIGKYLDIATFANPAWDMLLDLYRAALSRQKISISSLALASNVPPTTARRCIRTLIKAQLITRQPDPTDGRRIYLTITASGCAALDQIFDEID